MESRFDHARAGGRSRRGHHRYLALSLVAVAMSLVLVSWQNAASGSPRADAALRSRGTATFALQATDDFTWMLPYENAANDEPWDQSVENALWLPLYWEGVGAKPVINYGLSLAYPPVYSDNDRTVTIRLKHYLWSDGSPVTTRDIEFGINLFRAGRADIATYIAGDFPDNLASVDYVSPTEFILHVKTSYSQQWFTDNELTQIVPLPQQAWDKVSAGAKIGNYDVTNTGASRAFNFLAGQSKDLSSYATNSLWKTVDGPWRVTSYNPGTGRTILSPNSYYSGTTKPHLNQVILDTFTSDTAEVDALRSGSITYGWIPYSDYGLIGYFKGSGYSVTPWMPNDTQWAELGYTSPTYGPLVHQLYIRQALQHLVDEPLYIKTTLHGLGTPTYGPVPNIPNSPLLSPELRTDPDPYSISAARTLLSSHGWKLGGSGYFFCNRPGTASGDCGSGIQHGRQLKLLMSYATGDAGLAAQVQAFQTAGRSGGVDIVLSPASATTMYSSDGVCPPGPCNYAIAIYPLWFALYAGSDTYPTNDTQFGKGNYWGGGYYSPTAQALMEAADTHSGLKYLYADENYLSRQIAALWFPTGANQISVVSNRLRGWDPQPAFGDFIPQEWYLASR